MSRTKAILIVFWEIHDVTLGNWLSQDAFFNRDYFNENILQPIAKEVHREESPKHRPWTLVHLDNAKSHMPKWNVSISSGR
jgi:hypothetical protein